MVLACGRQTRINLGRRGALVWLEPTALPHVHQGIRLFRTTGHDAAGAVIFERPPDQHLVIGQQGRGQSVAAKATHRLTVEAEVDRRAAVNQPTAL